MSGIGLLYVWYMFRYICIWIDICLVYHVCLVYVWYMLHIIQTVAYRADIATEIVQFQSHFGIANPTG